MGLCKCPKRQVTNQFCFEHRVNVCEHCMVQSHPRCIVQSYLQWLRDSDYVSNCTLCNSTLDQGNCVRLICYHVFHWDCLHARQSALPANTAPRGHQCPLCDTEILPTFNLVSPVADVLKTYLAKVNWGRNGLGLALLAEDYSAAGAQAMSSSMASAKSQLPATAAVSSMTKVHHSGLKANGGAGSVAGSSGSGGGGGIGANGASTSAAAKQENAHSVLLMDAFNAPQGGDAYASSRRPLLPRQPPIGGSDRDDNKYKRRTPAEMLSRWSRRFYAPSSRPPWRRTWFLVLSGFLAFVLIVYLMAAFGRGGNTADSLDDSWNNPNPQPNLNARYQ